MPWSLLFDFSSLNISLPIEQLEQSGLESRKPSFSCILKLDDCLTFHLTPSPGWNFNLYSTLDFDQILRKLMTFPSALSVNFCFIPVNKYSMLTP